MARSLSLQLILTFALLATVRCHDDECQLPEEPTVMGVRDYIWCLRRQLYVIERDIMAAGNKIAADRNEAQQPLPEVDASPGERELEYELMESRKRSPVVDRPEETSTGGGGSGGQYAVNYGDIQAFPDCHGLSTDQCTSLVAFLEQTTLSLQTPTDDITGVPEEVAAFEARRRRSANHNSVNKLKVAHLKSKKLQQLDPRMVKNIKMLIRWQLQNGFTKSAPKFKGRWGRSVGHVTGAGQSALESAVRMRQRRAAAMKAWLAANVNSLSPKVKQMLADYLVWKARNPGFIKLTSRHG